MPRIDFNTSGVADQQNFDPLPADWYPAIVSRTEVKQTSKGTGHYLNAECDVIDGPYKGRKFWARFNIDNPNPTAVKIAQEELKALCIAVGKPAGVADSEELHDKPFYAKLTVKDSAQYGPSNEVKGYKPWDGAAPPQQAAPAAAQPAAAPTQAAPPPWASR